MKFWKIFFASSKVFLALSLIAVVTTIVPAIPTLFSQFSAYITGTGSTGSSGKVLGTATVALPVLKGLTFKAPVKFDNTVQFTKDLTIAGKTIFQQDVVISNHNLDLGTGTVTAANLNNLLNGVTAGAGIAATAGQTPTITNTGVLSFQGQTGAVTLTQGSGITISGMTITNGGVTSFNGQQGSVSFTAGTGLTVSGTTISQSLATNLVANGIAYSADGSTLTTLTPGTSGYILQSNGTGTAPSWVTALNLSGLLTDGFYAGANAILYAAPSTGQFTTATTTTASQCLLSSSGATGTPSWGACALGSNLWQVSSGALSPATLSNDLLLGGSSTTSAVFGFINVGAGTPTATISSNFSLKVPTGINPAATFNVLNGGTLNFQTSVGGDTSLASRLYIASSGNIGINTTSPTAKLDVNGIASISGQLALYGTPTIQSTANQVLMLGGNTTGSVQLGSTLYEGSSKLLGIHSNGNDGVMDFTTDGTTKGLQYGTAAFNLMGSYQLRLWAVSPIRGNAISGTQNGQWTPSSGNFWTLGTVGIGTSTPTVSLDIVGSASTSGSLTFRGGGAQQVNLLNNSTLGFYNSYGGDTGLGANPAFFVASNGNVGFGTSTTTNALLTINGSIYPLTTGGSTLGAKGNPWNAINTKWATFSQGVQFGTNQLTLGGSGVNGFGAGSSAVATIAGQTSFAALVTNNDGVGDLFTASAAGYTKFVVTNNGNVGIGQAAPSANLDIANTAIANLLLEGIANGGTSEIDMSAITAGGQVNKASMSLSTGGNIFFNANGFGGNNRMGIFKNGSITIGNITTARAFLDIRNNSTNVDQTQAAASISAQTSYAGLVIDNAGVGDLFAASQSGVNKFVITNGGNIGINALTPNYRFDVVDTKAATSTASITNLSTSDTANTNVLALNLGTATSGTNARFIQFYAGANSSKNAIGAGSIQLNNGNVAYNTVGADFAEYFVKGITTVSQGDVVTIDKTGAAVLATGNTGAIGIVSKTAGFLGNAPRDPNQEKEKVVVGLVGQLPVKVSTENGVIQPGDLLTVSSQAGVAMKATKVGMTIGKAMEGYTNTDTTVAGKIQILLNISWADPSLEIAADGNLSSRANVLGTTSVVSPTGTNLSALSQTPATSLPDYGLQIATLTSSLSDLSTQVASITAQMSKIGTIDDLTKRITLLEKTLSVSQIPLTSSSSSDLGAATENATVSGELSVIGKTLLTDLGVTGKINSGVLTINGMDDIGTASINTLAGPLRLQATGLNGLDILNGKIIVDVGGNLTINGTVTAKIIHAGKIEVNDSGDAASVGQVKIPAGQTKADVLTKAVTKRSKIFVTNTTKGSGAVYVTSQQEGISFSIEMDKPFTQDTVVNWWILN